MPLHKQRSNVIFSLHSHYFHLLTFNLNFTVIADDNVKGIIRFSSRCRPTLCLSHITHTSLSTIAGSTYSKYKQNLSVASRFDFPSLPVTCQAVLKLTFMCTGERVVLCASVKRSTNVLCNLLDNCPPPPSRSLPPSVVTAALGSVLLC